jgi:hypothetical protein
MYSLDVIQHGQIEFRKVDCQMHFRTVDKLFAVCQGHDKVQSWFDQPAEQLFDPFVLLLVDEFGHIVFEPGLCEQLRIERDRVTVNHSASFFIFNLFKAKMLRTDWIKKVMFEPINETMVSTCLWWLAMLGQHLSVRI